MRNLQGFDALQVSLLVIAVLYSLPTLAGVEREHSCFKQKLTLDKQNSLKFKNLSCEFRNTI